MDALHDVATHRHGCCVLQRCIDAAPPPHRARIVAAVADASLILAQDPFGNYVVQYVLDGGGGERSGGGGERAGARGGAAAAAAVARALSGHAPRLAQQKFASNVVERLLKLDPGIAATSAGADAAAAGADAAGAEEAAAAAAAEVQRLRDAIVAELAASPLLPRLLADPYANYVVQSALATAGPGAGAALAEAVKPHLPSLRGTPHGKRIAARVNARATPVGSGVPSPGDDGDAAAAAATAAAAVAAVGALPPDVLDEPAPLPPTAPDGAPSSTLAAA